MEHVVYLTVKKENRGNRAPVAVERLQWEQTLLSRVTLLEAYLTAWQQPSHVCGVIWDKIREGGPWRDAEHQLPYTPGLREQHRYFPDYQVWDRSFQGYLERHRMAPEWLRVWRIPVFDQYGGSEQLQTLMKKVEGWQQLSQVLVLGYHSDLMTWLPRLARRVRGIDFYLEYEPRDMEEIQEQIAEEYGMVTQWRILESREVENTGRETENTGQETENTGQEAESAGQETESKVQHYPGLGQYLRSYTVPCLVIDFTGVADIPVTGLKAGSMWWDMGAMERKRHLLEDRPLGVRYVSLRTLWRDLE